MNKNRISLLIVILLIGTFGGCSKKQEEMGSNSPQSENGYNENEIITNIIEVNVKIGDKLLTSFFYDNEIAQEIINNMPFNLDMSDYANQEIIATLPFDIPLSSKIVPETVEVGDCYVWDGNKLVIFTTSFSNSYSYNVVGKINDFESIVSELKNQNNNVQFSIIE